MSRFDILIVGAGAAGMQLAMALGKDPFFSSQKIGLIEKDQKDTNDRTWCFWEEGKGQWDHLIVKSWGKGMISNGKSLSQHDLSPFTYKMLPSSSFYEYCKSTILQLENIEWIDNEVKSVEATKGEVQTSDGQSYSADYVFDSRPSKLQFEGKEKFYYLKQHFLGWFVKMENPVFDDTQIHFMDFRVKDTDYTCFMYLLPTSPHEALLEYTFFSHDLVEDEVYEKGIKDYLNTYFAGESFDILEKEKGVIPMTNYPLEKMATEKWFPIGSVGGWTKASTGYTFKMSEMKVKTLVEQLKKGKVDTSSLINKRFRLYDEVLLNILDSKNHKGAWVFEQLFKRVHPPLIFKFLNEETTFMEELQIFYKSPQGIFLKAFFKNLLKKAV